MKKTVLTILSIVIVFATLNAGYAKVKTASPETAAAIKLYKSGNYTQSYTALKEIVSKESDNALASYYLGMSAAQIGKKDDAIRYYSAVSRIAPNSILSKYAQKGQRCIETPYQCNEPDRQSFDPNETEEDIFIKGAFGSGFSNNARGVHEKQKIENLKREINRKEEIAPSRFKEYKDFSTQAPSDNEIADALRVLQRAGFNNMLGINSYGNDVSTLLGTQYGTRNNNDLLKMLYKNDNNQEINPQIIHSLLSTQMMAGF